MRPNTARNQGGFSLLEAIVAMTIMATSLLALYAWLATNTVSINRADSAIRSLEDSRSALAVVETINPMAEPSGSRLIRPLEVRWKSKPLTDVRHGMSVSGMATQFDFQLFQMEVEVFRDGKQVRDFTLRRAGWKAARPISLDDF